MNSAFSVNWDTIKETIENECHDDAHLIQSDRYIVHLSFDTKVPSGFSWWFGNTFGWDYIGNLQTILNYAKDITRSSVGEEAYKEGMIATPSLIICDTGCDQGLHLDIVGEYAKQFGMLLSPGSDSTKICVPKSPESIDTFEKVIDCLLTSMNTHKNGKVEQWFSTNDTVLALQAIKSRGLKRPEDSRTQTYTFETVSKAIEEGFGNLMRINPINHHLDDSGQDDVLHWKRTYVKNCPPGTAYSIDGGVIHCGSGSTDGSLRLLLFWTFTRKNDEPYDNDVQGTRLTLITDIISMMWKELTYKERFHALKAVTYCFYASEPNYRKFAPLSFLSGLPNFAVLLDNFNKDFEALFEENNAKKLERKLKEHLGPELFEAHKE